jgi:glycosyltransferase involved in cell wall biosynthesis
MNTISVSICIPAYNEESNMDNILKQIYLQKQTGFVIENIVVVSDGSTDNTVKIARKYKKRGVKVIVGKVNRGQTYRQNEILSFTSSDILVLLNGDLVLGDTEVIARLIAPIIRGVDLSAQWATPLTPRTFIERVLYAGFELKHFIYKNHKNGNNLYTCVGHMRALSKRFYSNVTFPETSDGEDQYLYFACINDGYRYEYIHGRNLYFKLPDNFSDYKKYAMRIFQTQKKFNNVFSEELVRSERALPIELKILGCLYAHMKYPFYAFIYIILHMIIQQWALRKPVNDSNTFEIATSTKKFSITN